MKPSTKKYSLLAAAALLLAGGGAFAFVHLHHSKFDAAVDEPSGAAGAYIETDWQLLRDLDFRTGKTSADLAKLDGKYIKIPGFVVPLEDDDQGLSEFLLVPTPQACIHVPPPPPNQMVMVRMKAGTAPKRSWGPVWIKGRLHIATSESQYGKIAFMLHGDGAEPYTMPEDPPAGPMPP